MFLYLFHFQSVQHAGLMEASLNVYYCLRPNVSLSSLLSEFGSCLYVRCVCAWKMFIQFINMRPCMTLCLHRNKYYVFLHLPFGHIIGVCMSLHIGPYKAIFFTLNSSSSFLCRHTFRSSTNLFSFPALECAVAGIGCLPQTCPNRIRGQLFSRFCFCTHNLPDSCLVFNLFVLHSHFALLFSAVRISVLINITTGISHPVESPVISCAFSFSANRSKIIIDGTVLR